MLVGQIGLMEPRFKVAQMQQRAKEIAGSGAEVKEKDIDVDGR